MCLKIFEICFISFGILLALFLTLCEFGVTKKMSGMKASDFIFYVAFTMFAYILTAFLLVFFVPEITNKLIIALFGLSPFVIGKFVSYHKLRFYSIIQIMIVLLSAIYVFVI